MPYKRKEWMDCTEIEKKALLTASFMAAYARYTELLAIEKSVAIIPVQPQDMEDLKRLAAWWNGLGERKQQLIMDWKNLLWVEVETNTQQYFMST